MYYLFLDYEFLSYKYYFWDEIFHLSICLLRSTYEEQIFNYCLNAFQNLDFFEYLDAINDYLENAPEIIKSHCLTHLALLLQNQVKMKQNNNNKEDLFLSLLEFGNWESEINSEKNLEMKQEKINKKRKIEKFCSILIDLFEIKTLEKSHLVESSSLIALIGYISLISKNCGIILCQMNLLQTIIVQLKEAHITLSLETTHKKRTPSEKRKVKIYILLTFYR